MAPVPLTLSWRCHLQLGTLELITKLMNTLPYSTGCPVVDLEYARHLLASTNPPLVDGAACDKISKSVSQHNSFRKPFARVGKFPRPRPYMFPPKEGFIINEVWDKYHPAWGKYRGPNCNCWDRILKDDPVRYSPCYKKAPHPYGSVSVTSNLLTSNVGSLRINYVASQWITTGGLE